MDPAGNHHRHPHSALRPRRAANPRHAAKPRHAANPPLAGADPQQVQSNDSIYSLRQVVDSLTDQDPSTGAIVPWLATRCLSLWAAC